MESKLSWSQDSSRSWKQPSLVKGSRGQPSTFKHPQTAFRTFNPETVEGIKWLPFCFPAHFDPCDFLMIEILKIKKKTKKISSIFPSSLKPKIHKKGKRTARIPSIFLCSKITLNGEGHSCASLVVVCARLAVPQIRSSVVYRLAMAMKSLGKENLSMTSEICHRLSNIPFTSRCRAGPEPQR